jgi:hypothetical protein
MHDTNPEIEASLDALAEICQQAATSDIVAPLDRVEGLLQSMLMSGYNRSKYGSLEVELMTRIEDRCEQPIVPRRSEVSSLVSKIASRFADLERQQY